jgi:hypothetical protein
MSSDADSTESAGLLQERDLERGEGSGSDDLPSSSALERTPDVDKTREDQVRETNPPSAAFLFFRLHSFIGIFSLFLMAMAQGFPSPHEKLEVISILQEFYILLACAVSKEFFCCTFCNRTRGSDSFCLFNSFQLGAITELELSQWLIDRVAPVLKDWIARGAFYLFLAVIATEESTIDGDEAKIHKDDSFGDQYLTALLLNISALGLVVAGCLYIIMGLFCMKGLKERCERENDERLRRIIQGQR